MRGDAQAVRSTKRSTFLSDLGPCVLYVKNEFPATSLGEERNRCCENMITSEPELKVLTFGNDSTM
jgi:hypothetical protein